jgi:chromosome segregation ATPase
MPDPGAVEEAIERVRGLLNDWDRFIAFVEAQGQENDRLLSRCAELEREQNELRQAHDLLRDEREHLSRAVAELQASHEGLERDYHTTRAKLEQLQRDHEAALRDRQDVYDGLDALVRRLKP